MFAMQLTQVCIYCTVLSSRENCYITGVLGVCMGSLFGCGWDVVFWAAVLFAYVPFYVQTWEEYYLKVPARLVLCRYVQ